MLPQDFVDVQPEAIFLGHGHGDHADNAAYVAKWTGATIYASPETCDVMQTDVIAHVERPERAQRRREDGAERQPRELRRRGAARLAARRIHRGPANPGRRQTSACGASPSSIRTSASSRSSTSTPANSPVDPSFVHAPLTDLGDPRYAGRVIKTPPPRHLPGDVPDRHAVYAAGQSGARCPARSTPPPPASAVAAGIIEIDYHFVLRGDDNFSFVYLNSAGPAKEGIGSGPRLRLARAYNNPVNNGPAIALAAEIGKGLFSIMDSLPATDVMFGSIISLGAAANQQRDIISYIQRTEAEGLHPRAFLRGRAAGSSPYYLVNWRETATAMGFPQSEWPELRWMVDPIDYIRPLVYDPDDERWAKGTDAAYKLRAHCN